MKNPICFALDVSCEKRLASMESLLHEHVGAFKIGLELFTALGPKAISYCRNPVVLDLKLHDIPETVSRAVTVGGDLGVKFMTLHVQQKATLEQAVKAAEPYGMTLLGVTVLTSMTEQDLMDLRWHDDNDVQGRVHNLVRFGMDCGLKGFVCSPKELAFLKLNITPAKKPFFLVPGIRPQGADMGDQKRTGTPAQAIEDGANLIVIGRPIRDAPDPIVAAQAILAEIESNRKA